MTIDDSVQINAYMTLKQAKNLYSIQRDGCSITTDEILPIVRSIIGASDPRFEEIAARAVRVLNNSSSSSGGPTRREDWVSFANLIVQQVREAAGQSSSPLSPPSSVSPSSGNLERPVNTAAEQPPNAAAEQPPNAAAEQPPNAAVALLQDADRAGNLVLVGNIIIQQNTLQYSDVAQTLNSLPEPRRRDLAAFLARTASNPNDLRLATFINGLHPKKAVVQQLRAVSSMVMKPLNYVASCVVSVFNMCRISRR